MKKRDSLLENIDLSLLSDGMAHLLSSCLSVGVTAEKCFVRTGGRGFIGHKGGVTDWSLRLVMKPRWGGTPINSGSS